MQKINFIPPIVFEISKLKNAAICLAKSIFVFNHAHLNLNNQFITLMNIYLHAKKNLYFQ